MLKSSKLNSESNLHIYRVAQKVGLIVRSCAI